MRRYLIIMVLIGLIIGCSEPDSTGENKKTRKMKSIHEKQENRKQWV